MKRCRHKNADHVLAGQFTMLSDGTIVDAKCEQFRCLDCGAWLSLGPSSDTGPHAASVACEVRAAELATGAHMDEWYGTHWLVGDWTDDEARGWCIGETNMQNHTDAWHAGYLARYIATHPDGGNE